MTTTTAPATVAIATPAIELAELPKVTKANAAKIFAEASAAAEAAALACTPTPMIVGTAKSLFSTEIDYSQKTYYVASGVCGMAGVKIRPARGPLVALLKSRKIGYAAYGGGYYVASYHFATSTRSSQSYEIACAAAQAAAGVLRAYGITAYVDSRLD